jgi:hypothetical protein
MYQEGGLYLDIKSGATRPLNEVIFDDDRFLLSQWPTEGAYSGWGARAPELRDIPGGEYQQWFIAAAPGHPFLKAAAEAALQKIRGYSALSQSVGKPAVIRITGPITYTRAIHPMLPQHLHRRVDSERDLGLCYSVYPGQEHERALGQHYSNATEPVVRGDITAPLAIPLRRAVRAARSALKQLGGAAARKGASTAAE